MAGKAQKSLKPYFQYGPSVQKNIIKRKLKYK